ncbi:nucleotide exchange factor GrpE [Candidatus Saccharibacteria bacterium]|nr:nucleotide exchange factor GrpE [Candidatus Saccharibacteria bacterium]
MKIKRSDDEVEMKISGEELKKAKVEVDASEIEAEIAKQSEKITELTGDLQRTRADFENYRKQVEVQKATAMQMTKLATVQKILPLIDDIDRAVASYDELKPLAKSLTKMMSELGLKKIELGEEFDPELAEAVMSEGEGEREVISEVLRPGYYYENEVLRPAMVKVQKI